MSRASWPGWQDSVAVAVLSLAAAGTAGSQEHPPPKSPPAFGPEELPAKPGDIHWHVELRRQFTDRATPEESSRTTLRLEALPEGVLSLFRVDLPFVDKEDGDAMEPRPGDLKIKMASPWVPLLYSRGLLFWETQFPTADPDSLGNGKYQVSPGVEIQSPLARSGGDENPPEWTLQSRLRAQQVVSVAGLEDRKDINYTKLEAGLKVCWQDEISMRLTPKVILDWEQDGKSGGLLELETNWQITSAWRLQVILGAGLWNIDVPTGYGGKVEIGLRFGF